MRKFRLPAMVAIVALGALIGYSVLALPREPVVPASPEVTKLIEKLESSDPLVRYQAAAMLGSKGAEAEPAIENLAAMLNDESKVTSEQIYRDPRMSAYWETCPGEAAARALAAIGEPAVMPLARALREGGAAARKHAAQGLSVSTAESALTALKSASTDKDPEIRSTAIAALGKMVDHRIQPLAAALNDSDPKVRRSAVEALRYIGSQGCSSSVTAALLLAFKDKDPEVRAAAARAFAYMPVGTYSAQAEWPLLSLLNDAAPNVRSQAASALGHQHGYSSVEPLIWRLSDSNPKVRSAAVSALNELTGKSFGQDPPRWKKWWAQKQQADENARS